MLKLRNWTAKRAGGRITINAVSVKTDDPIKIVGVDQISVTKGGKIIATRETIDVSQVPAVRSIEKFELLSAVEIPG